MNWFIGSRFSVWKEFLKTNIQIAVPSNWLKIIFTTLVTFRNSLLAKRENRYISNFNFNKIKIIDPVFIIGHWRSGTTYLHNVLINDTQFNYPTLLQVTFPSTFFMIKEKLNKKDLGISQKRPMDNVHINMNSPGEEEVAVWTLSGRSSVGNRLLRARESYYYKFLTLEEVEKEDYEIWKTSLLFFLNKISLNDSRQLILKSPEHTARIRILLNIFPNAKFINIHRNPIDVFKSTKHMYDKVFKRSYYHKVDQEHLTERIIYIYKIMYESFFAYSKMIPANNFADVGFEELQKDPRNSVSDLYDQLEINFPAETKEKIGSYLDQVKNYKQNVYEELTDIEKSRIYAEWKICFDHWNYPIT